MKRLVLSGFLGAVLLAVACQDELDVPTTGSIVLNIRFAADSVRPSIQEAVARAATRASATDRTDGDRQGRVDLGPSLDASSFTSVRATVAGPTNKSATLVLTDGFWEGQITDLTPGSYTVTVEALTNSELDEVGTSTATVTAGASTTANVTLRSFKPSLNAIAAPGTIMGFGVTWTAVADATGYRVEWSKASDFAGARTQTVTDGTTTLVAVSDSGTWNVRVRATASGVTGAPGDPRQVTVNAEVSGTSGDDPGGAPDLGFAANANQTIGQVNIAPAGDADWYAITACASDNLLATTQAAELTVPSPLNTRIRVYASDGTTLITENDDFGGSTDSRVDTSLPADGVTYIEVTGVSGTTGHYQLSITVTNGPNNSGSACSIPPIDSVVVSPGSLTFDALTDGQQLTAVAYANDAPVSVSGFTWDSDDTGVASVDANGLVTAEGNGTANITATAVTSTASETDVTERDTAGGPRERQRGKGDAPPSDASMPGASALPPFGSITVTVAQAPSYLTITPTQDTIRFIGGTAQFNASVFDRLDQPIGGVSVSWSSDTPGVATVDATGNATATGAGTANILATYDTVGSGVELAVIQDVATVAKASGDNQSGFVGTPLPSALVVRVEDAGGTAIPGVTVSWAVTTGGGSLSSGTSVSGANGFAQVNWTLGGAAGAQTVTASAGPANGVFAADAVAGIEWASAVSGNWSDGTKWVGGVVPGPTDNVLIGLDGTYTVTMDADPTVPFLQLGAATGVQTLDVFNRTVTVNGRLAVTGGGELKVSGATIDADTVANAGLINVPAGFSADFVADLFTNSGTIDHIGSSLTIDFNQAFDNFGSLLLNGTFSQFSTGTFASHPGSTIDMAASSTVDFTVAAATFFEGLAIGGQRFVQMQVPSVSVVGAPLSIAVNGELDITSTAVAADSVDNAGTLLFDNASIAGPVANGGYLAAFAGANAIDGQITTTPGSSIEVNGVGTTLVVDRGFTNNGSVTLTAPAPVGGVAELIISEVGGTFTNTGFFEFAEIASNLAADEIVNSGEILNTSTLCCPTLAGNVTNSGDLNQFAGELNLSLGLANTGTVTVASGTVLQMLNIGSPLLNDVGGFLQGGGTVDVTSGAIFTNAGSIGVGPTSSLGILTVDGDLTLMPTSIVDIEIDGMTPGVDQDRLDVTGVLNLDGTLNVLPGNALDLTYGNRYQVITWANGFNSAFVDTSSLDLGGAYALRQDISGIDLTLELSVPQVVVTPGSAMLTQLGATQQFSGQAQESNGTPIPGIMFTWSSSNPAVAQVDGTGLATANGSGAATISAIAPGGRRGTAGLTVAAGAVKSVTVTPRGPTIDEVGNSLQLAAEVRDEMDNVIAVPVTWTTLHPEIASVDATGLVTAVGPGQTAIRAQADTALGFATVTVVVSGLSTASVWADYDDGAPYSGTSFQDIWADASWANIWAVGDNGTVARLNGCCPGSWLTVDIGAGNLSLSTVWGLGSSNIWIGAGTGEVFEWNGSQWNPLPAQAGGGVLGIWAASPRDVWIALPAGQVSHWDGASWAQSATGTPEDLLDIWGSSAVDVWASGRNGALVHYNGISWSPVTSNTGQNIVDLWGAAGDDIWAVANSDTLLHYNGASWAASTTGTGTFFVDIWGFGRQDIYATGSQGNNEEIWHYDGIGWTRIAAFDRTMVDLGGFSGLTGAPGCQPGVCPAPEPRLTAVTDDGKMLRGMLGATVTVTPASPTLIASNDAVAMNVSVRDSANNQVPSTDCCGPPLVQWSSDDEGVVIIDAGGVATPVAEGSANLTATAYGGAADTQPVSVDFSFTGSVVVTGAGDFADRVVITPGNVAWDGDEFVRVSGEEPWIDFQSTDSIVFRIPDLPVDLQQIQVFFQGPNQFLQFADLNVVSGFDRRDETSAINVAGGPFPFVTFISLEDDAAPLFGTDDHYFTVNPAGTQIGLRVTLEWQTGDDLDVGWTTNAGESGCCVGNLEGFTLQNPEVTGEVVQVGVDWRLWFNKFNMGTPRVMARVTIAQTTIGTVITAGLFHTCAIGIDGEVQCWGANDDGQLGDGTNASSTTPTTIPGMRFIQVDAGDRHTCGVAEDGDTYCWGFGDRAQLGNGSFNTSNTPVLVSGGLSFAQVAAGGTHTCGLTNGSEIYCWGDGQNGQVGDGSGTFQSTPVQIALAGPFIDVTAGGNHSCAIDTGGNAFCWGANFGGQLGDGTNTQSLIPVGVTPVALRTFAQITAGGQNTCAVMDNGDAYCWGNGTTSGSGSATTTNVPALVINGFQYTSLDAGVFHVCGVTTGAEVRCWGLGDFGERGDGSTGIVNSPVLASFPSTPVSVAAGGDHTCAVNSVGDAFCWGRNSNGQLGDGTTLTNTPQLVSTDAYTSITSGVGFTCARNTTVGKIECWGEGSSGQLGDGLFTDATVPTTASGGLGVSAIQLDAGDSHICGVRLSDATAWCWGANSSGQLGDNTTIGKGTAAQVADSLVGGLFWDVIAAGGSHTCGIDTSGIVWCWGANSNGQLGIASSTAASLPQQIWDPTSTGPWSQTFVAIGAGAFHSCGVTTLGDMYCWGFNGVGELGNGMSGSGASSNVPVLASGGLTFATVDLGRQYSCGATTANTLFCWGSNGAGQYGNGTQQSAPNPTLAAGGQTFVTFGMSSGTFDGHTCGVDDVTFQLSCFGNNRFGQLGDLTQSDQLSPVLVTGPMTWSEIAPSRDHTCGLDAGGLVYCWGDNSQGFLGLGTQHRELFPVAVSQNNRFLAPPPATTDAGPREQRKRRRLGG